MSSLRSMGDIIDNLPSSVNSRLDYFISCSYPRELLCRAIARD